MKKFEDIKKLEESYKGIYKNISEADAAQQSPQTQPSQATSNTNKRIKDMNGFNTNLTAIDQMEDKITEFMETAQKTGWLTQTEMNSIKQVLQSFLTGTLTSLMVSTDIKNNQQGQEMIKAIQSKIKLIDINQVTAAYEQAVTGQAADQSAAPGAGATPGTAPGARPNLGYSPGGGYRWQSALDTISNFKQARGQ